MLEFVRQLLWYGQVTLESAEVYTADEIDSAVALCREIEQQQRTELPGAAPIIDEPALRWSLAMIYSACQLHVFRSLDESEIELRLASLAPSPDSASAHYSVDVFLRFLPDLYSLVQNSMPDDPLSQAITHWANMWPLSSIGIPGVEVDPTVILADPCLRQMYVDRILKHNDLSRLANEAVQQAMNESKGAYDEHSSKAV